MCGIKTRCCDVKRAAGIFILCLLISDAAFGLDVLNAGVNGNNSSQGVARLDTDVISHRPDICFIAFGMNDAVNDLNSVPLDEFKKNLRQMRTRCRDAGIQPVFITVNPVNQERLYSRHGPEFYEAGGGANVMIDAYNRAIKEVAEEEGAAVIDWHKEVMSRSGTSIDSGSMLRSDGVHLTSEGLSTLAALVAEWIKQNDRGYSTVVAFGDSISKQGWIDIVCARCVDRPSITYTVSLPSSGRHRDTDPPSLLLDGAWKRAGSDSVQYAGDVEIGFSSVSAMRVEKITVCCFNFMDYSLKDVVVEFQNGDSPWQSAEKMWRQIPVQASVRDEALVLGFGVSAEISRFRVRFERLSGSTRVLVSEVQVH